MANKVNVELGMNVKGFVDGMNQATESTKTYETTTQKVKDSLGNFKKEFGAARREVMNLASAYSKLDATAKQSQFGKEMARQLDEAKQKAAEMLDMQGDLNQELKNMASDTRVFDTMSEGMGVFLNTTSAALGIVAQFTGNEKDAQKAIVAFTTAQSVLQAATKIQNALQAQSNLMLAINAVQNKASAAAVAIKTAAESKGIIVTKAATVAQAAFNAVAKANPYVLLATAIVTVISGIAAYIAITKDEEEEQERVNQKIQEHIDSLNKQADAYVGAAGESIILARDIENLREEYKNCNDQIAKTAILEEAAVKFKKLGMEVKGTNQAEEILIKQGDKVIELIRLQGEMAAVTALKVETLKNSIKGLMQLGFDSEQATNIAKYNTQFQQLEKTENRLRKETAKLKKDLNIKSDVFGSISGSNKKEKTEVELKIEKESLAEAEKKLKELEEKRAKISLDNPDLPKIKKEIEDLKKDIAAKKIKLGIEVEQPKSQNDILSDFEKQLKVQEDEAAAAMILAQLHHEDALKIEELTVAWEKAKKAREDYEGTKQMMTEGVQVEGNKKTQSIMSGETPKTVSNYQEAINVLQEKINDLDYSSSKKQFDEYAAKIVEMKTYLEEMGPIIEEALQTPTEKAKSKMKQLQKSVGQVGDAVQAAGELFAALGEASDDEGMKVVGIVAKAVATVALSFAQALASCKTWVEWLAFGIAGAATMVSLISQINSVTSGGYAEGGIIGGSSYSGDRVMARVNSGEMVLNQRQQRNLFNLLDQDTMPQKGGMNVTVTGVIRGTDLLLVQQNTNKVRSKTGTQIHF